MVKRKNKSRNARGIIEANSGASLCRLYFMDDEIIVANMSAANTIIIVIAIMIPLMLILGFTIGLPGAALGGFLGGIIGGIVARINYSRFKKRLEALSPYEILRSDNRNYVLHYRDIENIDVKYDPNSWASRDAKISIFSHGRENKFVVPEVTAKKSWVSYQQLLDSIRS